MASKSIDRKAFLSYLRQSGLLTDEQMKRAEGQLPDTNRGRLVARALVEMGLLTRFQAERLLAGRTAGFHLGQYRILEELGRGGMGRVFKAEHRTLGRIVALKVLAPNLVDEDRAEELFLREVRAAAQLAHPNIVTAYDANCIDGRYFLVMEYVDGPSLQKLVEQRGPLEVGLACDYIVQTCQGLQSAHLLGMVHRDIKPSNILVQRRGIHKDMPGVVKVGDFGLARLHAPGGGPRYGPPAGTILARDNTVMGTPDYLSPEQARSLNKVDIRSDLYSLGCTFYFLLTGQPPFPGGTALEKMIRHTTDPPRPVTDFRTDVPQEVLAILARLLAKDPADRFATPADLAAALGPFAVSGPIPWAPPMTALPLEGPSDEEIPVIEDVLPPADDHATTAGQAPEPGETATSLSAIAGWVLGVVIALIIFLTLLACLVSL